MAVLTTRAVVDRVQARLATALAAGWTVARGHPATLGTGDSRQLAHHAYSAWSPSADAVDLSRWQGRQRLSEGTVHRSRVEVRFLARLRADSTSGDVDAAYDDEDTVRLAVLSTAATDLQLSYIGARRSVLGEGTYQLHELSFDADHRVSLQ